jgi:hypothetical protein
MRMPNDAEILEQVRAAFARCERPEHFTNYTHCPECAEHDALLLSRDVDTLRVEDVGNPAWDPLCYVAPAGFGFFFPALARLALDEPSPTHGWYPEQLLFHLTYEGNGNRHLLDFAPDQRRAVVVLLRHIAETRHELLDEWLCGAELEHALDLWSGGGSNC